MQLKEKENKRKLLKKTEREEEGRVPGDIKTKKRNSKVGEIGEESRGTDSKQKKEIQLC